MKLRDWFFRQLVGEDELDASFQWAQDADRAMVLDTGLVGITTGMGVGPRAASENLSVDVAAGVAYDKNGARIAFPATVNVDVSVDENGASTAVSGAGKYRVTSVFVKFERVLSEPRTDGNSQPVFSISDEGCAFIVRQGAETSSPSSADGAATALDVEMVLLAEIRRYYGQSAITTGDIFFTRTEDAFVASGATFGLARGRVRDAVKDIVGFVNSLAATTTAGDSASAAALAAHKAQASNAHPASAISYAGSGQWSDGSNVSSANVEAAIDEVVSDLGVATGAVKIGAAARVAQYVFGTTPAGGTVQGLLDQVTAYLDVGPRGKKTTHATSAFTLSDSLRRILVDSSAGAFSIALPSPSTNAGVEWEIKDVGAALTTNPITLTPFGGEKIESVAGSYALTVPRGTFRVYSDGVDWFVSNTRDLALENRTTAVETTLTALPNITALKNVANPTNGLMRYVYGFGLFTYDSNAVAVEQIPQYVSPASAPTTGRWIHASAAVAELVPNGFPILDATGKILASHVPNRIVGIKSTLLGSNVAVSGGTPTDVGLNVSLGSLSPRTGDILLVDSVLQIALGSASGLNQFQLLVNDGGAQTYTSTISTVNPSTTTAQNIPVQFYYVVQANASTLTVSLQATSAGGNSMTFIGGASNSQNGGSRIRAMLVRP